MNKKNFKRPNYIIGDMVGYVRAPLTEGGSESIHIDTITGVIGYVNQTDDSISWHFQINAGGGLIETRSFEDIVYAVKLQVRH